jgi:nucleoside-diphosphate-sugar epimerase
MDDVGERPVTVRGAWGDTMALILPERPRMKVLVTGGTGVVGQATVQALLDRGHEIRLLSRHAADDVRRWPHRVEPWAADIGSPDQVERSADGCDAILHLTGIVEESPPDATFQRINVDGTRHVVREASRAGIDRFIYVSSLGA